MPREQHLNEWMDDPNVDPAMLASALKFIRHVNDLLGGTRAVLGHLQRWSRHWPKDRTITILDVATGSADIPLAIVRWARKAGFKVHIIALDLHPGTLKVARGWLARQETTPLPITFVQGDALALPLADGTVDYALSSMFFHHLTDEQALQALREMQRVATRGVVINDLLRSAGAKIGIALATLFADPVDKHDARVSVRKAWQRIEVEAWAEATGAPWMLYRYHGFARFTLAGEVPQNNS